ncbi:MAG: divalent-cation tolerance protein CutA [Magnetovibrio sp.]|nr:divalent-cation tolerance protein CutA [Magnetovibrio sp.]
MNTSNNSDDLKNGALQIVYVTAPNREEALNIAKTVVGERLAACANLLDAVHSVYWWEGEIQEDTETVIILKTRQESCGALIERIKDLHSYDCPCVVALDLKGGNDDFLNWIVNETRQADSH